VIFPRFPYEHVVGDNVAGESNSAEYIFQVKTFKEGVNQHSYVEYSTMRKIG